MMKTILLLAALVGGGSCPTTVHCDYHMATAVYSGDEYPNGTHYRVYSHDYTDQNGRMQKHQIRQKCD